MKNTKIYFIITMGILCLSLIGLGFYMDNQNKEDIDLGNIQISSMNLKTLSDQMPEGKYAICSLKEEDSDNPCVPMLKGKLE